MADSIEKILGACAAAADDEGRAAQCVELAGTEDVVRQSRPVDDGRRLFVDIVFADVLDYDDHFPPRRTRYLNQSLADGG